MIENQLNPKFKNIYLGFSKKYTLYSDGCAIFSLSNRLNLTAVEMNELLKEKDCFAVYNGEKCIINWSKIPSAFPKVKKCVRVTAYNNEKVLEIIERDGGCIVCVDYDGNSATTGDHFVVFKGNKKLEDPLGGKEKPTSTYPLTKGYVDLEIDNGIIESDMTTDEKNALELLESYKINAGHGNLEGAMNALIGATSDLQNKNAQIATLSQKVLELDGITKKLQEQVDILTSEVKSSNEIILDWQQKFKSANEQVSNANEQVSAITDDRNKYRRLYENLLSTTTDKMTAFQLIKLGISKLFIKK